jgi:hypothetical protein
VDKVPAKKGFLALTLLMTLRFLCRAPRDALHGPQAGTRFVMLLSPPLSSSMRWSACVAGAWPHQ